MDGDRLGRQLRHGGAEEPCELVPDGVVTLAGDRLEAGPITDSHATSRVLDQPGLLQHAGGDRHAGPAHAQHERKELVSHGELVRPGAVVRGEEPLGEALLDGVACIAASRQCHLSVEGQGVMQEERPQRGAPPAAAPSRSAVPSICTRASVSAWLLP